jgi:hypothetical protein
MPQTINSDPTPEILKSMLTENTGRSIFDSGDYYGRNYELNQKLNLDEQPSSELRAYVRNGQLDLIVTHNVYHWLDEKIEFAPDMDRNFQRFAQRRPHDAWLQVMEEFAALLELQGATGIYGDGSPMTVNTYNGPDCLSQVLQYVYYEFKNEAYVLLQIHGGCDVRGGYSRPRAFTLTSELSILDNARAELYPDPKGWTGRNQLDIFTGRTVQDTAPSWTTDDGYHWYAEGTKHRHLLSDYPASEDPDDRGNGIVYVDEDHQIYCPISARKLIPSYY